MTDLKCKRVLHPSYSPDLAIADFHLFDVLKQELQGIDAIDEQGLKREILSIFEPLLSDEPKKSFPRWIERCQWAAANAGTIIHHSHKT
jgi:hypothetical protein